jgi:hypothetical protein
MFVTCCLLLASLWGLLASAFCQVPTLFFIQIPVISHLCFHCLYHLMSPLLRWWRTAHRVSELLSYMAPTSALSWGDGLTRPWRSRPGSRHGLKSAKLEHRTLPFWTDLHGIRVWETIGKMGQLWGNKGIHAYICMNINIMIYIYICIAYKNTVSICK